ncbi:hypothetical protein PCANC_07633 [Puccinia coronata f. sp. avenae]|uniref:Uncharacterized protein n=1 Tax=Puccinia coronata f. sp. avenae TaxID=200324 RepID=A0A2N5T2N0_9BASI|nr:hypothetical protein PCANC_07633 [Puccinia coronata f. sp. avenae]
MPIQKTHLIFFALVCSAWGSHINRHQELEGRNLPASGQFYTSILKKRGDDASKEPAKPAGGTKKSDGGASDTADDVKKDKKPAKPTDKTDGNDKPASKVPIPKDKITATPAPTSATEPGVETSPPTSNPKTVDAASMKEKLAQHRKKVDDFTAKLRKKVDGRLEKLKQDQKKGDGPDSNPTPPPTSKNTGSEEVPPTGQDNKSR